MERIIARIEVCGDMRLNIKSNEDTIAAISTPVGEGGIGVVRLSGPRAYEIGMEVFNPRHESDEFPQSHRLYYGHVVDERGEIMDEVMVSFMKAPATYTREDIVEINCHSGVVMLKMILDLLIRYGARMAEPGEFTKRAFINGRIDLSQAESVLNLIQARSEKAAKSAVRSLQGELAQKVKSLKQDLVSILASVEATLDFPEDVEDMEKENLAAWLNQIYEQVQKLYESSLKGSVFQNGLKVSIVGKPNVGKSSLLNILVQREKAIVTEIPGTTRDVLEEQVNIKGVPVWFMDTAGIRQTGDPVENIGVTQARETIEAADLVLVVIDASTGIDAEDREILQGIIREGKEFILVVNKIDISDLEPEKEVYSEVTSDRVVKISAKELTGIEDIENILVWLVEEGELFSGEEPLVLSLRHQEALLQVKEHLGDALENLETNPLDIISVDLKMAEEIMGEITGDYVGEDLLDHIFSNFCIGK